MIRPLAAVFALAISLCAFAEDLPYLVRDLPGTVASDSMGVNQGFWTTIGNTTWFPALSGSPAKRLGVWKTDGTEAGTVQVTNNVGHPASSNAPYLGIVNGKLVYAGSSALFAVDVSTDEIVLLADVLPSSLRNGAVRDGVMYFPAQKTPSTQPELWRTDGTPAGTRPVDFLPGSPGEFQGVPNPRVYLAGDWLFFYGITPRGMGLHRTDGTLEQTTLLYPLTTSQLNNSTNSVLALGNRVLFHLGSTGEPTALRATDGTTPTPIAETMGFRPIANFGDHVLFNDDRGTIWTTDGTLGGTHETDILAGTGLIYSHAGGVAGNKFYFYSRTNSAKRTLQVTEGSAASTRAIMEVDQGPSPSSGFVIGERFCFQHIDRVHGSEIWWTDGTSAQILADVNPDFRHGIDAGLISASRPDGKAIFIGRRFDTGREPWITDGTASGTRLLANIAPDNQVFSSSPRRLCAGVSRLYFIATQDESAVIGVSDGTRAGTSTMTATFFQSALATAPRDRYFFLRGFDPVHPEPEDGFYSSDGTVAGTWRISSTARGGCVLPAGVVFTEPTSPHLMWFSDGTPAGTRVVRNIQGSSLACFRSSDAAWLRSDSQLWRTDGTDAGTVEGPLSESLGPIADVIRAGSAYYFLEGGASPKLWRWDGMSSGMQTLATLPYSSHSPLQFVAATESLVYFAADDKLYRSDGSEAGTVALTVPAPCGRAASLGDLVVFPARSGEDVIFWSTRGTPETTTKLLEIVLGMEHGCAAVAALGNFVYFNARDTTHSWEPWVTDGTVAGTKMLFDLMPGFTGSYPGEFTRVGDRLFFVATTELGRELWAIGERPEVRRRGARH